MWPGQPAPREVSVGHLAVFTGTSTGTVEPAVGPGKPDVGPGACCARKLRGGVVPARVAGGALRFGRDDDRVVEYVVVLMLMVKCMLRALQKTDQVLAVR